MSRPYAVWRHPESFGWHNKNWALSHPDNLAIGSNSFGWLMTKAPCHRNDAALSHSDDKMRFKPCYPDNLVPGSISSGWLMANGVCDPDDLRCYHLSSGWHIDILTLSHPDKLAPGSTSPGWLMANELYHPNDLGCYPNSSQWRNEILNMTRTDDLVAVWCAPNISRSISSKWLPKDIHSSLLRARYGCLSWVPSLTEVLPWNLLCYVQHRVILHRDRLRVYSISSDWRMRNAIRMTYHF